MVRSRLAGLVLCALGVSAIVIGVTMANHARRLWARTTERAVGAVIDLGDGRLALRFEANKGVVEVPVGDIDLPYEFEFNWGQPGSKVEILYDPDHPEVVRLPREHSYIGEIFACAMGLLFALVGIHYVRRSAASVSAPGLDLGAEQEILELLRNDRKLEAIKRYREATGAGLAEAKMAVEELGARQARGL